VERFFDEIGTGLGWLSSPLGWVIGLAAFVLTIVVGAMVTAAIKEKKSYDLVSGWMGDRRRTLYLRWLDAAENKLQRFFGSRLLGWYAFDRCLLLACAYPIFLLLLAWVLGAAPSLANVPLLDASLVWPQRAMAIVGIVPAVFSFWWVGRQHVTIATWLARIAPVKIRQQSFVVSVSKYVLMILILGISVLVLVLVSVLDLDLDLDLALGVALGVALTLASVLGLNYGLNYGSSFGMGFSLLLSFGLVAGFGLVFTATVGTVAIVVFLGILPLVNAAMDWMSWAVSRGLLRHLIKRGADAGIATILWHAAVDLFVAVALLIGVAVSLPFLLQLGNMALELLGQQMIIAWWEYLSAAQRAPFGEGLFVTGMLLSTLLPTAGHFLMLVVALLFPRPVWFRQSWLDWLTTPDPARFQRIVVLSPDYSWWVWN
jgi:hypothetical protein